MRTPIKQTKACAMNRPRRRSPIVLGAGMVLLAACSSADRAVESEADQEQVRENGPAVVEPDQAVTAAPEPVRLEPTVLATVQLSDTHIVKFEELLPGVVVPVEKLKMGENKPVLNKREYSSLVGLYRDLAGKNSNPRAIATLKAADERVAARRALIAESRDAVDRSARIDAVAEQARKAKERATEEAAVQSGLVPITAGDLVEKGSCSFSQSIHNGHVAWFRDNYCDVDSNSCYALTTSRWRWIDHLSFMTNKQVFVAAMNAQRCNNADWDVYIWSDCGTWDPCSHGFMWQEEIEPGWAQSGNVTAEDFHIEPNVYGSGNDADKDVFLTHDY